MSAPGHERVDVDVLADECAGLERRYPIAHFARLADTVSDSRGEAVARFDFARAGEGVPACEMDLEAVVTLTCQRCLEPYKQSLRSEAKLAFVTGDEEAGQVPEGYEAVPAPNARVDLLELVEDELLLSLPVVALHGEGTQCAGAARQAEDDGREERPAETHRPFAQLQDLLKH
jgi:uncharacterized protein